MGSHGRRVIFRTSQEILTDLHQSLHRTCLASTGKCGSLRLDPRGNQRWLSALIQKILDGSPTAARLLRQPDLKTNPPKFVRLAYYEYNFTTVDQRRATGHWWNRSFLGALTGPIKN